MRIIENNSLKCSGMSERLKKKKKKKVENLLDHLNQNQRALVK